MENQNRYNKLNEYLKNKFGERTLKICVDGGFTCPNRDGTVSKGGCIFCSERGSGEHINNKCLNKLGSSLNCDPTSTEDNIVNQIQNYFLSYKSTRANKFIVYFQNFTNTYDSIENLKRKYNSALIDDRIVGISIATRPDCITEDIVKLLYSYTKNYYVEVELGLQTSNNETGKLLNRGYSSEQFTKAVKLLNKYNIDVVTHIMVGLPNETKYDLENTVKFLNLHNIQGLKIHSTYVVKNTKLCELYNNGLYVPISLDEYLESVVYILTHIDANIVIHRISGDAPKNLLVAPEWNSHKKLVLNGVDRILRERNMWQGMFM